jgi:hypothetical protein
MVLDGTMVVLNLFFNFVEFLFLCLLLPLKIGSTCELASARFISFFLFFLASFTVFRWLSTITLRAVVSWRSFNFGWKARCYCRIICHGPQESFFLFFTTILDGLTFLCRLGLGIIRIFRYFMLFRLFFVFFLDSLINTRFFVRFWTSNSFGSIDLAGLFLQSFTAL